VVAEQHLWDAVARGLGLDACIGIGFAERSARAEDLNRRIADAVARHTRDDAVARLAAAGAPVSPVLGAAELADDPSLQARGVVRRASDGRATMSHPVQYLLHPAARSEAVPPLPDGSAPVPRWATR
jgi:crotonobetainyl-CoA:carnitine CoA-transferase CaiB-like acyl-CoA transferase